MRDLASGKTEVQEPFPDSGSTLASSCAPRAEGPWIHPACILGAPSENAGRNRPFPRSHRPPCFRFFLPKMSLILDLIFTEPVDSATPLEVGFNRAAIQTHLASLAELGIYLGTSSWKYPGWCGSLYDDSRYLYRGRFSESRFNRCCLEEYAEVFKTVSVDAAYYTFPTKKYLEGLIEQVPETFQFVLKVTDEITVKHFPKLPRFGNRAGKPNVNFLNPELFVEQFLEPCRPFRNAIGLLIFEFSRFHPRDFRQGREFLAALDRFLQQLPLDWPLGIELRNRSFLRPEYFQMLRERKVAHVFNNWEAMPSVEEQLELEGAPVHGSLTAARFLLKPGRKYHEAVSMFSPYQVVKEPNESARNAGARMIRGGLGRRGKKTFILVNNRLEGNALVTIQSMLEGAARPTS